MENTQFFSKKSTKSVGTFVSPIRLIWNFSMCLIYIFNYASSSISYLFCNNCLKCTKIKQNVPKYSIGRRRPWFTLKYQNTSTGLQPANRGPPSEINQLIECFGGKRVMRDGPAPAVRIHMAERLMHGYDWELKMVLIFSIIWWHVYDISPKPLKPRLVIINHDFPSQFYYFQQSLQGVSD